MISVVARFDVSDWSLPFDADTPLLLTIQIIFILDIAVALLFDVYYSYLLHDGGCLGKHQQVDTTSHKDPESQMDIREPDPRHSKASWRFFILYLYISSETIDFP